MFTSAAYSARKTTAPQWFIRINESGDSVKRICLLGAAIAGLLIIGVGSALAATPHASKAAGGKSKSSGTKVSCSSKISLQVPSGETDVTAGATQGTQYGTVKCGSMLGSGVQSDSFTTDDAGDLSGKFQQYFNAGSVFGTYVLSANDQSGPPTIQSFSSASYTGTVTIKNGTGVDKGASGKGTLNCSTADAVHFTCTEKVKISLPTTSSATHGGG
jgi:hypothetical protein